MADEGGRVGLGELLQKGHVGGGCERYGKRSKGGRGSAIPRHMGQLGAQAIYWVGEDEPQRMRYQGPDRHRAAWLSTHLSARHPRPIAWPHSPTPCTHKRSPKTSPCALLPTLLPAPRLPPPRATHPRRPASCPGAPAGRTAPSRQCRQPGLARAPDPCCAAPCLWRMFVWGGMIWVGDIMKLGEVRWAEVWTVVVTHGVAVWAGWPFQNP